MLQLQVRYAMLSRESSRAVNKTTLAGNAQDDSIVHMTVLQIAVV
jgi:hypothetical protein